MPNRSGFPTATPYLIYQRAADAIEFYKKAFNAIELTMHADPDGQVRHAEIQIGTSPIMMTGECPEFPDMKSAQSIGGSPVHLFLYVDDVDSFASQAVAAGATTVMPIKNESYGRSGGIKDPFGITWWICTHKDGAN